LPERCRSAVHVGQGLAPEPAAPGPTRAVVTGGGDGRHHGGVLRLVHQPRGVRGGVPEVDLHRLHRVDEPRLPQGEVQAAPPGVAAVLTPAPPHSPLRMLVRYRRYRALIAPTFGRAWAGWSRIRARTPKQGP